MSHKYANSQTSIICSLTKCTACTSYLSNQLRKAGIAKQVFVLGSLLNDLLNLLYDASYSLSCVGQPLNVMFNQLTLSCVVSHDSPQCSDPALRDSGKWHKPAGWEEWNKDCLEQRQN